MNNREKYAFDGVEFFLHDLDVWLPYYGGNKVRKLKKIEEEIRQDKKNAIVTTGGIQSNHCRATSLFAARQGYKCILILHGKERIFNSQKGNALLMRRSGAECRIVSANDIASSMDKAMRDLKHEGFRPYYLPGGGHNRWGVEAYIDAVTELETRLSGPFPDHIFLASGTGSTQAGILMGLQTIGKTDTQVHGISVARNRESGVKGVVEAISMADGTIDRKKIHFYDDYLFGGYGKSDEKLRNFTEQVASETGIIVDNTYTGKAFYAMIDMVRKKQVSSNVLFWHTGGILNLMA